MKMKLTAIAALTILAAAVLSPAAQAEAPGAHPGYLHALSDLRAARWNLEHRPGDAAVSANEDNAISEIDRAIGEVQKAAARDGKDPFVRPREDANLDRPGRLHHAVELLRAAQNDLNQEEDNPESRGLKHRALEHVNNAIEAARHAVGDVEHGR
jgi:hypothetical protein